MSISFPAAITGGAQTGFTAPVFNTVLDFAQDTNQKQVLVSSLGGTMAGVDAHSIARPFTLAYIRQKVLAVLGKPNPVTGLITNVPRNTHKFIARKGVTVLAGQPSQIALGRVELEIPAGADIADPANVRALISCLIGALSSMSAGTGDTCINGAP